MGANFVTLSYHGTKKEITTRFEKDQERDRYENGHSYSGGIGMARGLTFIDLEVDTEEQATAWLDEHCVKWDNALAVKIKGSDMWIVGAVCSA